MKLGKDAQIINMVNLIGRVKKCLTDRDWKLLELLLQIQKIACFKKEITRTPQVK